MKRLSISFAKKIGVLIFGALITLTFVSCEYFNLNVEQVLKEKLDTAVVEKVEFDESETAKNARGIVCMASDSWNQQFKVWVRNPRAYNLIMSYNLDDGSSCTSAFYENYNDYLANNNNEDISCILENGERYGYVILSQDFAHNRELSARDISGSITLLNQVTGISFAPYSVELLVNSPPPDISNTKLQRDSTGSNYILCFEMKDLSASGYDVHYDTHVLNMNGREYFFDPTHFDGTIYTDIGCTSASNQFVTTRPAGMRPLKDEGEEFEESSDSDIISIYYLTGVPVTTSEKTWNFYLQDDDGLVTPTHKITNIEKELNPPVIRAVSGSTYWTGEYGYYELEVTHDLKCLTGESVDALMICLYLYDESGNLIGSPSNSELSSSRENKVTFAIDRGNYSMIKAVAKKEGYTSSDPVSVTSIEVKQTTNFYVSSEVSENQYQIGTATYPFRTIQKAVNNFLDRFPEENTCNIYVLDDITPSSSDYSGSSTALVSIPGTAAGKTINIYGWDKNRATGVKRTIDARRTSSSTGRVFNIAGGTVTLKNLTITGGYADCGAGVAIESAGAVTLTDCTITGNTATSSDGLGIPGAGLYLNNGNSAVTLTNCTISNNTSLEGNGGGIAAFSGSLILNGCTFTSNRALEGDGGGLYQYQYANTSINGITMTGNTAGGNGGAIGKGITSGDITLNGTVSIPGTSSQDNGIYLEGSTSEHETIAIGSTFTYSGNTAVVDFPNYIHGSTVFTGNPSRANGKFKPAVANYIITTAGELSIDPNIYVSSSSLDPSIGPAGSSSGDGSQAHPYEYLSSAISRINTLNVAADYIIHISGNIIVNNGLTINSSSFGSNAPTSIKIIGTDPETDKLSHSANGASVLAVQGGYTNPVYLENLTIRSGMTSSGNGGGVYVGANSDVRLKNCIVTGNRAMDGGGLSTVGSLTLDGVTVSGNHTSSTSGNGGGIHVGSTGTLKIKGKVTVTGNTNGSGASATTNNVYLYGGSVITVDGALDPASRIGVTTYAPPSGENGVTVLITSGLTNSGLTATLLSAVFTSDAGYAVVNGTGSNASELVLAESSGTISGDQIPDSNMNVTFTDAASNGSTVTGFYAGYEKNIYITAYNGTGNSATVIPSSLLTYNSIRLMCGSTLAATLTPTISGNAVEVTIPSTLDPDNYTLNVTIEYNGIQYDPAINIVGREANVTFTGTSYTTLSGVSGSAGSSGTYVLFGDWPQTIKAASVSVDESVTKLVGDFTYYLGSDGAWYAKQQENAYDSNYTYSDGTAVAQLSAGSYKYFKVEPIKWRVVTTDYNGTGKKLLLAENILINGTYYDNTSSRTISGSTVYPNNYKESRIRAYLNGLSYNKSGSTNSDYSGKGFLQTAFTSAMQSNIATVTVDNREASTTDAGGNLTQATDYVCADTSDKIFLLSVKEVTTTAYGFASYSELDTARVRKPTDFAMSTGACTYQFNSVNSGGYWWLRSPGYNSGNNAKSVNYGGIASNFYGVKDGYDGVVPALCYSE